VALKTLLIATLLLLPPNAPSAGRRHFGSVVLMGKLILIFDDTKLLFHAGMTSGDFFDRLERRMTDRQRFYLDSSPVSNYPDLLKVNLFANQWTSGGRPEWASPPIRCTGVAKTVMEFLETKAEWKTGMVLRPVSKITVRRLGRSEMAATAIWGYELTISSKGVPLTDHLVVSVYGPDSSLIARFSGAP
jgi:hypothetical protein